MCMPVCLHVCEYLYVCVGVCECVCAYVRVCESVSVRVDRRRLRVCMDG